MFKEILLFEVRYRLKRIETYVFFAVIFLFSMIAFNFIYEGQSLGDVKENAPFIIMKIMSIVTGFFMIVASMIMGVTILRDFENNMQSLFFVNPISKLEYVFGRFSGSFIVLLFVFSSVVLGVIAGLWLPWRTEEALLPFSLWSYMYSFISIVLPGLFFGGAIFFIGGTLSRKMIVVYVQGLVFLLATIISSALSDPFWSSLLDPLGIVAMDEMIVDWKTEELNGSLIPFQGYLLYNRLFWLAVGAIVLLMGYKAFQFKDIKESAGKKSRDDNSGEHSISLTDQTIPGCIIRFDHKLDLLQLRKASLFYFRSIVSQASFWAIVVCAIITISVNTINLGNSFGVNSYPVTYLVLGELKEMSIYFFLMILMFYPGELLWKERKARMDGIYDALPISDTTFLASKLCGLVLTYVLLLLIVMLAGMSYQAIQGFYSFQLDLYLTSLLVEILPFLTFFTVLAFFFQVVTNSKFIGQILVLVFFILMMILGLSGLGHGLYTFGGIALASYSDMNGYGDFIGPFLWFKSYWLVFCLLLLVVCIVLCVRGTETSLRLRFLHGRHRLTPLLKKVSGALLFIFITIGGYIFYNTNILNRHFFIAEQLELRSDYETTLKQYEYLLQPKIIDIKMEIELFPKERSYSATGHYILQNQSDTLIEKIHIQKAISDDDVLESLDIDKSHELTEHHEQFGYRIYTLSEPLLPGDSLELSFYQIYKPHGFTEDNDEYKIVTNGTFFDNDRFPSVGYNHHYEIEDENDREAYGLGELKGDATREDILELKNGVSGDDGSRINFEMLISTDEDQIAIAPGELIKQSTKDGRSYFHYKSSNPMINFYSIVSAEYEVLKDEWASAQSNQASAVDLEIYYHKGHHYNTESMMKSMKRTLDYCTQNFGFYPYRQLRIMEYPRYRDFAQSFPSTIPMSESMGFIMDVDPEEDVDMPFYVTAHEVAHQWWGLNVVAANVQGQKMILETLSQYVALMVLKEEYGKEKVVQYLQFEKERYKDVALRLGSEEQSLMNVEDQESIYYSKGAISIYMLQERIGEEQVNRALKKLVDNWSIQDGLPEQERFATTDDLTSYFKEVSPDSLHQYIDELMASKGLDEEHINQLLKTL